MSVSAINTLPAQQQVSAVSAKRVVVLVVGTALLLFLGLIYAYSVLLAPFKAEHNWPVSGMTLIFALSISSFTIGGLLAGQIVRRKKTRTGFILGAAFLLAGFLGTAAATGDGSLVQVCVTYGVLASFGIGVVYNIVIPVVSWWFPDKPGLAQGVCLMGFGMGGFLLGPVITGLYAKVAWRPVIALVGAVFALIIVVCAFVIRVPRVEELGLSGDSAQDRGDHADRCTDKCSAASRMSADLATSASTVRDSEACGLAARKSAVRESAPRVLGARESLVQMFHSPVFYLEFLFLFCVGSNGMGITGLGRELPLSLGVDDMAAALIIGFVNIGSGFGRLGGGMLLDRLGSIRTMRGIAVIAMLAPLAMAASLAQVSVGLQLIACLLFGLSWGAAIVTMPFITRREWGQENLAQNMAIVNTYSIFGSMVGSFGAGILAEACGSYMPVLAIMGALAVVALLIVSRMGHLRKQRA